MTWPPRYRLGSPRRSDGARVEANEIAKRRRQCMIRIAISADTYNAIRSTLPEDAPLWPVRRGCLIHVEAAVLDRLRAMRSRRTPSY